MRNRGLSIALAVLLAIVGTAGILVYVSHANSRAVAGQRAVTVLVAQKLIPAGTSAGQAQQLGLLGSETLPAASVPANAVTALTPDLKALVTSADVQSGQLLLRPMLVTASQATSGLAIPPGMVAVSLTFCLAEAVAGNVHPGSEVAVFQTVISGGSGTMTAQTACNGTHQWTAGANFSTRLVLPKVEVLSVQTGLGMPGSGSSGTQSGSSGSGQAVVQLLTLAVSQADAQQLILMTEDSLPYLALVTDQSGLNVGTAPATISGH